MRNDTIDSLLLRHYGSSAPAPAQLEQNLSAAVRQEASVIQASQQRAQVWQRPVSRRRVLRLVTFSGAGLGALTMSLNALQGQQRPAYSA